MMHSINDLTTFCRKTTGDVPAKLVGASTTVVGSKMYLFGGRLVTERKMVSDLYVFDMDTFNWERIPISPEDDVPRARYFHSADTWNNKLIIFGGMSNQPDSLNPEELCVLNDVRFFDIATRHWLPAPAPSAPATAPDLLPRARYAHLSSVTADRLFIIGGQDFNNTWLDDVCVYDLATRAWVQRRDYPRHCGTYRSVAVSSSSTVRFPMEEGRTAQAAATLGPPGQRFGPDRAPDPNAEYTPSESLIHQPYSAPPTEEHPSDIFLYSNYNFTDVKRELEVFSPLPEHDFTIQDKSSAMAGTTFPPGLRFPTGALLGTHLIIAGTYLAHSYQSFSIWVLDLTTMAWTRIDAGKAVESGSWFRGSLYAAANKFVVFGNRNGNLVDDYNRRLLSWDHVAVVDLEAFGVYQPPGLKLDLTMQELGLAALEERAVADFEIVCEDGRRVACSRKILEERWPWFLEQRKHFSANVQGTLALLPDSPAHLPMPELPGNATSEDPRVDPRFTSRALELAEPYPIVLALLQYFYTTALVTPLQHAPAVLSQLLLLSTNYGLKHLEGLVKHAMHRALSNSTSVGVYEVATLCSCRSLQIRALKTVMAYTQKRPSRSRNDKDSSNGKPPGGGGGGGGGGPTNGPGPGPNNDAQQQQHLSRPRGTSDARWRTMGSQGGSDNGNSGYSTRAALGVEPGVMDRNHGGALSPTMSLTNLAGALHHPHSHSPHPKMTSRPRTANTITRWRSDPALSQTRRHSQSALAHPDAENPTDAKNSNPADLNHLADLMGVPSTQELQTIVDTRRDSVVVTGYSPSERSATPVFAIPEGDEQTDDTPVPAAVLESHSDMGTPVPGLIVNVTEDQSREDQITPLPTVRPRKSQRRGRAGSIVSIHTEEEMLELVDYFSDFTTSEPDTKISNIERDDVRTEHSPSIIMPDHLYLNRSNRNSFSPSVAPSLSASVLTMTDSEHSDHISDKHESLSIGSPYHRNRPLRIFTDSMQSIPPSLTSSASNSSLSTSRYTSPATPLTSNTDLLSPTDLGIIDERYIYDNAMVDSDNLDPFSSKHASFFAQDHPVKKWPQQRSNVSWTPSPPPPIDVAAAQSSLSLSSLTASTITPVTPVTPEPPMSPRTPGGSTFGRLLGRKKDDAHAAQIKEKEQERKRRQHEKTLAREKERIELERKSKEKKPKETPEEKRARLDAIRKEKIRKALAAEPAMMGGMMALA